MFLIAFWSLKQAKNEEKLGIIHGKVRLKLNYMKNPSFGELRSLCQINQVCKEENQRRNLTLKNLASHCEIFARQKGISQLFFPLAKFSQERRKFRNLFFLLRNFRNSISDLRNLHVIFRYFCTDSVRFLPQDILCNYLFSPCNQLKIFLDIGYLIEGLKISLFIYLKISLFVISISESWKTFLGITCTFFSKKNTELCSALPTHFDCIFFLAKQSLRMFS